MLLYECMYVYTHMSEPKNQTHELTRIQRQLHAGDKLFNMLTQVLCKYLINSSDTKLVRNLHVKKGLITTISMLLKEQESTCI